MKSREYKVTFVTPGFLGNAEQSSQWRTPPFKALLRQWWRISMANKVDYIVDNLRNEEGELFGHAGSGNAQRSKIRIRFNHWNSGTPDTANWLRQSRRVSHPEVDIKVGAHLYLGYGPIEYQRQVGERLKHPPAIMAGSSNQLKIQSPEDVLDSNLFTLVHWFGTVGSRSRNGWGSLVLTEKEGEQLENISKDHPLLESVSRDYCDCLKIDWPHAIGRDNHGLLIWETDLMDSWEEVINVLAEVKIMFRTQLKFKGGNRNSSAEDRHLLAYPVTHHNAFGAKKRYANQVRFKVINEGEQYKGRIVHIPCGAPQFVDFDRARQEQVWHQVHNSLDNNNNLGRLG